MKLSEKQLLIITIVVPAIIAIVLAVVGYFVFSKKTSSVNKEIVEVNKKIKETEDRRDKMTELDEKLTKLRKERNELELLLPTKTEISYENFLDTLTKFSREAEVHLSSVSFEPTKTTPSSVSTNLFDRISYKLSIQGDFFQVIHYIYLVETYQRFIKVDKFSVRPAGQSAGSKTAQYSLDLSLTTYGRNPTESKN